MASAAVSNSDGPAPSPPGSPLVRESSQRDSSQRVSGRCSHQDSPIQGKISVVRHSREPGRENQFDTRQFAMFTLDGQPVFGELATDTKVQIYDRQFLLGVCNKLKTNSMLERGRPRGLVSDDVPAAKSGSSGVTSASGSTSTEGREDGCGLNQNNICAKNNWQDIDTYMWRTERRSKLTEQGLAGSPSPKNAKKRDRKQPGDGLGSPAMGTGAVPGSDAMNPLDPVGESAPAPARESAAEMMPPGMHHLAAGRGRSAPGVYGAPPPGMGATPPHPGMFTTAPPGFSGDSTAASAKKAAAASSANSADLEVFVTVVTHPDTGEPTKSFVDKHGQTLNNSQTVFTDILAAQDPTCASFQLWKSSMVKDGENVTVWRDQKNNIFLDVGGTLQEAFEKSAARSRRNQERAESLGGAAGGMLTT